MPDDLPLSCVFGDVRHTLINRGAAFDPGDLYAFLESRREQVTADPNPERWAVAFVTEYSLPSGSPPRDRWERPLARLRAGIVEQPPPEEG
ncbi:MAG TPA: hypothetical protein VFA26_08640 [Gemmataceae bacterium]|nr:hypothetical protein [Gemmataceae bacterium]